MTSLARHTLKDDILVTSSISAVYALSAYLGLMFVARPEGVASFWPPSGVFLAAVLMTSGRRRKLVLGSLFCVNALINAAQGNTFPVSVSFAVVNATEAWVAAGFYAAYVGKRPFPLTIRNFLAFVLLCALLANGLTALAGAAVSVAFFSPSFWSAWYVWWVADGVGMLLITPIPIAWTASREHSTVVYTRMWWMEFALLSVLAVILGNIVFRPAPNLLHEALLLPYILFPFQIWAAMRMGIRGTLSVSLVLSSVAIYHTGLGNGPFSTFGHASSDHILALQLFLIAINAVPLILAVGIAERDRHRDALAKNARQLHRTNRSLRTLSDCNQVLIRATTEQELLENVCRVLVDVGGYRMVWVGYPEEGGEKRVKSMACAGVESDYLTQVKITWGDDKLGCGPVGTAIKTSLPAIIRDTATDPSFAPWREQAELRGYRSLIALPMTAGRHVFGAFALYASEPNAFDEAEIELLTELAGDLSFGVGAIRVREEQQRNAMLLAESELRHKALFDAAHDAILILQGDRIVDCNARSEALFGRRSEELLRLSALDVSAPIQPDGSPSAESLQKILQAGSLQYFAWRCSRPDGSIFETEVSLSSVEIHGETFLQAIIRDVTERIRSEEQIKSSLLEKETLLKEIHHRVKNNMQVISSLLSLQAAHVRDKYDLQLFLESQSRVRSMALVHEKLYQSASLSSIDVETYIKQLVSDLLALYANEQVSLRLDIHDIRFGVDVAIPCGLIVNELVSNSLKYAFQPGEPGEIYIALTEPDSKGYELVVADNGAGLPAGLDFRTTTSLGLQLVTILTQQLGGSVTLENAPGTRFRIMFSPR